jgi:hypothetical protein
MKTVFMILVLMFVGSWSFGSVRVKDNAGVQLGSQNDLKCSYGVDCAVVGSDLVLKPILSLSTFASGDATPSVSAGGPMFRTYAANTVTITDFDDGYAGQEIVVQSKGPVTFDVTSSGLLCGSTDLATSASGDVSRWVYDGTDWNCTGFLDYSDNLN